MHHLCSNRSVSIFEMVQNVMITFLNAGHFIISRVIHNAELHVNCSSRAGSHFTRDIISLTSVLARMTASVHITTAELEEISADLD